MVEHDLAKVGVASSSLVYRSFLRSEHSHFLFPCPHSFYTMNLYLRFFNDETFVHTVDEALDFLRTIPEITVDRRMEDELRDYVNSEVSYPKRYKVHARVYFIVIKTNAASMAEFKANRKSDGAGDGEKLNYNKSYLHLKDERPGWYEGTLKYKQVLQNTMTGKFEYHDAAITVRCKANSASQCYERIVSFLKDKVDARSQFPSARGKNFVWTYLGKSK